MLNVDESITKLITGDERAVRHHPMTTPSAAAAAA